MNETALGLAEKFEGFSASPYLCPAGYWTNGFGNLCSKDTPKTTREEALVKLKSNLDRFERDVFRLCPVLLLESEKRQAAIIDFAFNLGSGRLQCSTLRRRINQRQWPEVRKELLKWVYGGGRVLPGLVLRRQAEAALI